MSNTVLAVMTSLRYIPLSQKTRALISFHHKGEVVVVLGPSGCGKFTLLRAIVKKISKGEKCFHDQVISGQKRESAAAGIGYGFCIMTCSQHDGLKT